MQPGLRNNQQTALADVVVAGDCNGKNQTNKCHPKAKMKNYIEVYVELGFTEEDNERPVCLLCPKMLAIDSMKPKK